MLRVLLTTTCLRQQSKNDGPTFSPKTYAHSGNGWKENSTRVHITFKGRAQPKKKLCSWYIIQYRHRVRWRGSLVQYTCAKMLNNHLCWFNIHRESYGLHFLPHTHKHLINTCPAAGPSTLDCPLDLLLSVGYPSSSHHKCSLNSISIIPDDAKSSKLTF